MVGRARTGSEDALGELFRRHGAKVVRFAHRRTGSSTTADEVAVETFERAWRSIDSVRDADAVVGWLLRIAARIIVDRHRSDDRRRRREEVAERSEPRFRPVDPADQVAGEATTIAGIDDDRLRVALDRLSASQQEVIMLRFHADLSPAEAAVALEVSPSAAGVRLHRALAALRRELLADPAVSNGDQR